MNQMRPFPLLSGDVQSRLEDRNETRFPDPVRPIRTMDDLLCEAGLWTELPAQNRRILKAHIRTAAFIAANSQARVAGRTLCRTDVLLASVPADVMWLNAHLFSFPAAIHGLDRLCHTNSITGLRRILRRLDLIEPYATPPLPTESVWRSLLDSLGSEIHCRIALTRFAAWCEANGIAPNQVTRQSLASFETFVRTRSLHGDIPRLIRTIAKAWRKAARALQAWPKGSLAAPPRRENYTLPWTAFPISLQNEVAAFAGRLSGESRRRPFRGDGPRRVLRPSTIKSRLYSLRQAASALVLLGRDPATITSLADLVEEAAMEAILQFYWERAISARTSAEDLQAGRYPPNEVGVTAQTGAIASALMMVAKHHCKLERDALLPLRSMAADLQPLPQTELSQKNSDRLRQFNDPVTRALLLHLPDILMKRVEASDKLKPFEAARLIRVATAINLLLHIPMRIQNLTRLRLGMHLKSSDTRHGRISHIVVKVHETKNHQDIEWWVGPDVAAFLDRYIKNFRPILALPDSDWLFPAGFSNSGPLSLAAMAQSIVQTVAEEVGAVVNPHFFRCLCARLILEDSPGALEDVRLMLGDKTLQAVLAHYTPVERKDAGQRVDNALRRQRNESAHLIVKLAPSGRKPWKPGKPTQ